MIYAVSMSVFTVNVLLWRRMWTVPEDKGLSRTTRVDNQKVGSATSGGILDKAIEAEENQHGDFLRLEHVEGYLELSAKTKSYFATAISLWDADLYVKVDDDLHVNIGTLAATLAIHRSKPSVYIGCMKSGPVLALKYHEPEHWKFGEDGNKYFRHATGQLYANSKDLATYISINQHILLKYANEDVTLGSWFIGLDVEHIDDRKLCCGTPPDSAVGGQALEMMYNQPYTLLNQIAQCNPEWSSDSRSAPKKLINMKLSATQPVTIINVIQQAAGWCEVYGNSGRSMAMCAANPESVMYVGNAQRQNYGNVYNIKWQTQPLNQPWNSQQQQIQQPQA
ncbi:putative beta-1,3-galactosyltransferase 2 [Capsicum baccatum]|uniref:Hexosyltransferase n=1 Tax=Capsicum baccatum TaxID=33114 RepID=A0A2G2X598_CAPBA|nr:putative beta-1,3-galactosyltransferase 2 [Capsicum baccatum]